MAWRGSRSRAGPYRARVLRKRVWKARCRRLPRPRLGGEARRSFSPELTRAPLWRRQLWERGGDSFDRIRALETLLEPGLKGESSGTFPMTSSRWRVYRHEEGLMSLSATGEPVPPGREAWVSFPVWRFLRAITASSEGFRLVSAPLRGFRPRFALVKRARAS